MSKYHNTEKVIIYVQSVLQLFTSKYSAFVYKTENDLPVMI